MSNQFDRDFLQALGIDTKMVTSWKLEGKALHRPVLTVQYLVTDPYKVITKRYRVVPMTEDSGDVSGK